MKFYLLGIFMICASLRSYSQYIEKFNTLSFPPNTSWSSALPAGMVEYNLDGLMPASQIAAAFPNNEAWVAHIEDNDTFAVSHSWYMPAGASNDWLVTPSIYVPPITATETPFLVWKAKAPDINFPDGYLVKISTSSNFPNDFYAQPLFEEMAAPTSFATRAIPLANFAGQTVHIGFVNTSYDKFMLYLDDIEIKSMSVQPDIILTNCHINRIAKTNEDNYISGTIVNNSAVMITDATINWTDGNYSVDMIVSGLNILPLQSYDFVHNTPFQSNTVDEYNITLSVPSVNNGIDIHPNDNLQVLKISTVSMEIPKAVVFEEVTGTWCGWCPRGIVSMHYMDSLYASTGQFIGISIHSQDTMAMNDYADSTGIHLIPQTNIDRILFNQETNIASYQQYYDAFKNLPAPAAMSTIAVYQNQQVSVQVAASFGTKISSGLRFAVILVEDSVHSNNSSFDQVNLYYYYGSQNPMGGFEYLPDPVPASQMWYNHVARALLGGYEGEVNSVPSIVYEGNYASYNFYYTLPYYVNPLKTKAIAILIDEQTGRIYNAQSVPLMYGALAVEATQQAALDVFPNPTSNEFTIHFETETLQDVNIALYNTVGQLVKSATFSDCLGKQDKTLSVEEVAAGTYLLSVSMQGKSFSRNVVIVK